MLIGEYQHTLDPKGRINFPSKLRESLGDKFIVTKGLDNCLFVYSHPEWSILEQGIRNLPLGKSRNLQRFFFAGAVEVECDKQGRVLIPNHLREYAELEKEVSIIGTMQRAEIWDRQRWQNACTELDSDTIAQSMEELGF